MPFCEDSDLDVTTLEHVLESLSSQLGLNKGISTACLVDAVCTDMCKVNLIYMSVSVL